MKAPFTYFGGKSTIANLIWDALGDVKYYLEPFAGSAAVLLQRPDSHTRPNEIINDKDCYIANFWRCLKHDPEKTAWWADYPISHADLTARHHWLIFSEEAKRLRERILTDPMYCNPQIAGWWVWGISQWIGRGWCLAPKSEARVTVTRPRPKLNHPMGIHRKSMEFASAKRPTCRHEGIHRLEIESCGESPNLIFRPGLAEYFGALAQRLARVVILCGDWQQGFQTPSILRDNCGIFFDPPYSKEADRDDDIYRVDDDSVAHSVRDWCTQHEQECRIVLAGYEGEHDELERRGWTAISWTAQGGFANMTKKRGYQNRFRERLWLSPPCTPVRGLFAAERT